MTIKNIETVKKMLGEVAGKANVVINVDNLSHEVWRLKTDMETRNYIDKISGIKIACDAYFRAYELAKDKDESIVATIFMIATECLFKENDWPTFHFTEEPKLYHFQEMYRLGMKLTRGIAIITQNPNMYCKMVISNHFRNASRYHSA
jgi:hypothetical protein